MKQAMPQQHTERQAEAAAAQELANIIKSRVTTRELWELCLLARKARLYNLSDLLLPAGRTQPDAIDAIRRG